MTKWFCTALVAAAAGLAACSDEIKVTGVEPPTGSFNGGEELVIEGANFPAGRSVAVRVGKRDATNIMIESDKKIRVTTPAGDRNTSADVSLVFDDGKAFMLKGVFRYIDPAQNRITWDKALDKVGGKK